MDDKLEKTVEKTIEALARIQRFISKYGSDLSEGQIKRISTKLEELQKTIGDKETYTSKLL